MIASRGVEEQLHIFLTSALDGSVVNFTTPAALPLGKNPDIH
jgi:hypothetical protein